MSDGYALCVLFSDGQPHEKLNPVLKCYYSKSEGLYGKNSFLISHETFTKEKTGKKGRANFGPKNKLIHLLILQNLKLIKIIKWFYLKI